MPSRIRLEPATPADAGRLAAAVVQPAAKHLSFFAEKPPTVEEERDYLERMHRSDADELYLVVREQDGAVIGTGGLHEIDRRNRNCRLGLLIFDPAERTKGYGREAIGLLLDLAFGTRGFHKVYLRVFAENERARALYLRLGFIAEGTLRQEYLLAGTYHDMIVMSLLEDEWNARRDP
jgi:RimJ/RimL family protein N-acetyltransferase